MQLGGEIMILKRRVERADCRARFSAARGVQPEHMGARVSCGREGLF